ncbi:MAG: chromate transporter [Candidatus Krumholzibacteria bacterium]|nr:chromate transporter [Candidatus Krumholzibacteria bacterium]
MGIYGQLMISFFKTGLFGFGGGPSIIPLVEKEVVTNYHWLTQEEFIDVLAMANALPGPIATKMALCVGLKVGGPFGAAAALGAHLFPSTVLILILATFYFRYRSVPAIQGVAKGVRPVVVALLLVTVANLAPKSVFTWEALLIAIACFAVVYFLDVHPIYPIIAAGLFGLFYYK